MKANELTNVNFKDFKTGDRFITPFFTSHIKTTFEVTETNDTQIIAKQFSESHGLIGKECWFWIKGDGYITSNKYR